MSVDNCLRTRGEKEGKRESWQGLEGTNWLRPGPTQCHLEVGGVEEVSSINTCVGLCIKGGLLEEAALPGGMAAEGGDRGGGTEALRPALSSHRLQGHPRGGF